MAAKRKRAARKPRAASVPARAHRGAAARRAKPAGRASSPKRAPGTSKRRAKPPARRAKATPRKPRVAPASATGVTAGDYRAQHMDYTTHNLEEIKRFYGQLLGFSGLTHDPAHNYVNVPTGPGSSLGFMPPMPGPPEQWRPPREPAIYFFVADVDRLYRELAAKGVAFRQAPTDMPWGHRVAMLSDPEGRTVCLAQSRARRAPA